MSDLINRNDAIIAFSSKNITDVTELAWSYVDIVKVLSRLPSANGKKWIPVTEDLPADDKEKVLVTFRNRKVGVARYDALCQSWHNAQGLLLFSVIAWMPWELPEPYMGGKWGVNDELGNW